MTSTVLKPDSGPRITLPGPLLPPDLQARKDLKVIGTRGPKRARRGVPGWVISLGVMVALLGAGLMTIGFLIPASHTAANAKPVTKPQAAETVAPASQPIADLVEVTGLRFIMDLNNKSEIHYVVVNHSTADLTGMTVYVTVKSADPKPGQPPVCRFSFRSPALGPFESKEMVSSIEKLSRPVTLPDWRDLRTEVQISQ